MAMGSKKSRIKPVQDRDDKQKTYKQHLIQYGKAMKEYFYFEAILIDYACLEDRLKYMLFYLGVLESEQDYKIRGKSQRVKEFREILRDYVDQKANMSISSISGKRKIVESVFLLAAEQEKPENEITRITLWNALHDESHTADMLQTLKDIQDWCQYRNEIIHSLMNKNLESLNEQIRERAQEGYMLFRRLDQQVQWVKRKKLREKLKLKS